MKKIQGFEDYFVTEDGNIISTKFKSPRTMKSYICNSGYVCIDLMIKGKKHKKLVHRLVAEAYCEGYFDGAVVNHIDANRENNHFTNLEWCTMKYNTHQSYITSGKDQTRNYKMYKLKYPDGRLSDDFKGYPQLRKFIEENKMNISVTSLQKYKKSNGYELIVVD